MKWKLRRNLLPPQPSTPGRGRGDKKRGGGTEGRKSGELGCVPPEGVRWSPARPKWWGPRPSASGTEEQGGLSPHTQLQAGLSHVHSPRPEARAYPQAHTALRILPTT